MNKKRVGVIILLLIILLLFFAFIQRDGFLDYTRDFFRDAFLSPAVCNNNLLCDMDETSASCASDCEIKTNLERAGWVYKCVDFRITPAIEVNCDDPSFDYFESEFGITPNSFVPSDRIGGQGDMVKIEGYPILQVRAYSQFPVKQNTRYNLKVWFKLANVNKADLAQYFPVNDPILAKINDNTYAVDGGTSCGRHEFSLELGNVQNKISSSSRLTAPEWYTYNFECQMNRDWYLIESEFSVPVGVNKVHLSILNSFMDGTHYIDDITLEEIEDSASSSEILLDEIPAFKGMGIQSVVDNGNQIIVETTTVKYVFDKINDRLEGYYKLLPSGQRLATLQFENGLFNGLQIQGSPQSEDRVLLENSEFQAAIYQDSAMIFRSLSDTTFIVNGEFSPAWSTVYLAHLFAATGDYGILVFPFKEGVDGGFVSGNAVDQYYDPPYFRNKLYNDFVFSQNLAGNPWTVSYNLPQGQKYGFQVFPPKIYDEVYECKETYGWARWLEELIVIKQISKFNTLRLEDRDTIFKIHGLLGPLEIEDPVGVRAQAQVYHGNNMKYLLYTAPFYYYTYDGDIFLSNMQTLLNDGQMDGFYYDTLYQYDALKSWDFLRKTRSMLQDRILILHDSQHPPDEQADFRLPMLDAYADLLYIGEVVGTSSENDPRWIYSLRGRGVSNVPNYVKLDGKRLKSDGTLMSDIEQIDKIHSVGAKYLFYHSQLFPTLIPNVNWNYYYPKMRNKCLPITCGDGVCDRHERDPGADFDTDIDDIIYCAVDCGGAMSCVDADLDGYGVCPDCDMAKGCSFDGNDCADNNNLELPGQTWYKDADNDGYSDGISLAQ
ncbi:MAG: hypothetical protein AABX73_01100, partial [Nanoarchaeota archaeon]